MQCYLRRSILVVQRKYPLNGGRRLSLGVMERYIDRLDWEIWANRGVVLDLLRSIVFDRQGNPFLNGTYIE